MAAATPTTAANATRAVGRTTRVASTVLGGFNARRVVRHRAGHRWRAVPVLFNLRVITMTTEDIKRMYDNNPMLTLRELSAITGLTIAALKRLLLS